MTVAFDFPDKIIENDVKDVVAAHGYGIDDLFEITDVDDTDVVDIGTKNQAYYDNMTNQELAKYGNVEQWAKRFQKIFGGMQ